MKLYDCSFRELEKKWVVVNKWKDIKRIGKKYRLELVDALVLIYLYIDHEKGLCGYLVGNLYHDSKELLQMDTTYLEHMIVLEDDILSKIKFQIIDDSLLNHLKEKDIIEQKIDIAYYNDENILNARGEEQLDEWRNESNPDDIELLLITDKKEEFIWGRLELFSKDRLICRLLDSSKTNEHYKKNDTVLASIVKDKKTFDIIIQYKVEKKNSN